MNDYLMPRPVTMDTRMETTGEEEATKAIALDSAALISKGPDLEEEDLAAEAIKEEEEVVEAVAAEVEVEEEEAVDAAVALPPLATTTTATRVIGGKYYLKIRSLL